MALADMDGTPEWASLAALHRSRRPRESVVAWRPVTGRKGDTAVSLGNFLADIAELARGLGSVARGDRFALYSDDSYVFAVGLFGLWLRGCVAVTPPNAQSGTLAALGPRVAAILSDDAGMASSRFASLLQDLGARSLSRDADEWLAQQPSLPRDAVVVELFTSGTTGDGKSIAKELHHLDDEVAALESLFGDRLASARIFATGSHQHLYGLLFGVLWPLASGRQFNAQSLLQAEELVARTGKGEPFVLASVPAHLKRIARRDAIRQLARGCCAVFSSGGPLTSETAQRWLDLVGHAPIEVFGSTETGGIAWRTQAGAQRDRAWTAFPGVEVGADADGCLSLRSPFLSVGGPEGFAMSDRVQLLGEGRFELGGRSDRAVKIGEKRLDLEAMESRLHTQPGVAEAAVITLPIAEELRVVAAVVPSAEGAQVLAESGRRAFARKLGEALALDFDRVLLPRAWRFPQALPEDAQGKRQLAKLRQLFDTPPSHPRRTRRG